jgi:hypothetical protein
MICPRYSSIWRNTSIMFERKSIVKKLAPDW